MIPRVRARGSWESPPHGCSHREEAHRRLRCRCALACARRLCNHLSAWPTTSARVRRARALAVCCASRTSTRLSIVATALALMDAGASSRWPPSATAIEIAHGLRIRHQPQVRPTTLADNSAIEWTEATWNPVTGCEEVSPGCAHCYAETFAERWRGAGILPAVYAAFSPSDISPGS